MKTITKLYRINPYRSNLMNRYFGNMRMGVFDIETLGLYPNRFPLILSGMLTISGDGQCRLTQHFAESLADEPAVLQALRRDFEEVDFLFTYNGRNFDLPFLEKRAQSLKLAPFHYSFYNLDLYLILNGYSEVKNVLDNIRQKTVENYMGISQYRGDTISGAESVELYTHYLKLPPGSEKDSLEEKILLHNHDDLLQLYKLLPIMKQVDLHRALNNLGFPVAGENGWPHLNVSRAKATNKAFTIWGKYYGPSFSYLSYDTFHQYYSCEFSEDNYFIFKLPVDRHKGNSFVSLRLYLNDFSSLKKFPGYANDFLLVGRGADCCSLESNMFAKRFLSEFMNGTPCPRNLL